MSDQADQLRRLVREAVARNPALGSLPPIVTVCSAATGAGATTVACRTARELARLGQRVLLIDADMTDANLVDAAGIQENGSIAEVLDGRKRLVETLASAETRLRVLAGRPGASPTPPLDQLALDRLISELTACCDQFDCVVVDAGTAPNPWCGRLWRLARTTLLVTTPSQADIRDSYRAVKLTLVSPERTEPRRTSLDASESLDGRLRLVVNQCSDSRLGTQVGDQFQQTCRDYLKLRLSPFSILPPHGATRGAESSSFQLAVRSMAADLLTALQGSAHHASLERLSLVRRTGPRQAKSTKLQ